MYSIPNTIKLDNLKGTNIQQICFAANNIVFWFENVGFIQVESDFTYFNDEVTIKTYNPTSSKAVLGIILNLIESKVEKVETDAERKSLILYTSPGNQRLEVLRNDFYESMQMKICGTEAII